MKYFVATIFLVFGFIAPAMAGTIIGLHLGTKHFSADKQWNDFNPGAYAKLSNGFTAGVFKNSESNTSYYVGATISKPVSTSLEVSATIGVMQGYNRGTMLFALPSVAYKFSDYALRIGYVPKIDKQGAAGLHLMLEQKF